jgi:hypothetical protein
MEEARCIEEEYDEKLRLEREKQEDIDRELSREERIKAREEVRELRAQRTAERDVKSTYHKDKVRSSSSSSNSSYSSNASNESNSSSNESNSSEHSYN